MEISVMFSKVLLTGTTYIIIYTFSSKHTEPLITRSYMTDGILKMKQIVLNPLVCFGGFVVVVWGGRGGVF